MPDQEWMWGPQEWLAVWQEIADSCEGVTVNDPRYRRVVEWYVPHFDQCYANDDVLGFKKLLRNFHVGCPVMVKECVLA